MVRCSGETSIRVEMCGVSVGAEKLVGQKAEKGPLERGSRYPEVSEKKRQKLMPQPIGCSSRGLGHYEKSRGDFSSLGGKPMGVEPMPSCEGGRGTYSGKDVCLRRSYYWTILPRSPLPVES